MNSGHPASEPLRVAAFTLDVASHLLLIDEQRIELDEVQTAVMAALMRRADRFVHQAELIDAGIEAAAIREALARLRRHVGAPWIRTAQRSGYVLRPYRTTPAPVNRRLRAGSDLELDADQRIVRSGSRMLLLGALETHVLATLMRVGGLVRYEELVATWPGRPIGNFEVSHAVFRLQRRLGRRLTRAKRGVGYRLWLEPPPADEPNLLRVGELELDPKSGIVRFGDQWVWIGAAERRLLAALLRDRRTVVPSRELIDPRSRQALVGRTLKPTTAKLRAALGADVIRVIAGPAYRLSTSLDVPPLRPARAGAPVRCSGSLTLRLDTRALSRAGAAPVVLDSREAALIARLLHAVGGLVTHHELMRVAGIAASGRYSTALAGLHAKLEALGAGNLLVLLEHGYRLAATAGYWRVAGLELDRRRGVAALHGRPLDLPPTGFALLERLSVAPGRVVACDELIDYVWGAGEPRALLEDAVALFAHAWRNSPQALVLVTADGRGIRLAIERFGLLAHGRLLLDPRARCARVGDREAQLEPAETRLLEALMRTGTLSRELARIATAGPPDGDVARLAGKLRPLAGTAADGGPIDVDEHGYRLDAARFDSPPETVLSRRFGDLWMAPGGVHVRRDEHIGELAPAAAALLDRLLDAPGEVVPERVLVAAIWGAEGTAAQLATCVAALGRVLARLHSRVVIERVGAGYRLALRDR